MTNSTTTGLTLAEVKRRCLVGTRLTMTFHRFPHLWRDDRLRALITAGALTRTVTRVQRNGIYLATGARESFLDWPEAAYFHATGPDSFEILATPDDRDVAQHSIVMAYRIELDTCSCGCGASQEHQESTEEAR